mmetsp:Transcript_1383/g.3076  ORF Transcript_1383/g.3076 Transcript_1383/m.3076 type:complete len:330 (+) Transcript_1383:233-1222(+)
MLTFTQAAYAARPMATSPAQGNEESASYRWWMFGDASSQSHHFMETAFERAPKEIGCALAASLLVSPMVSMIDKSIVQDVSGNQTLMGALKESSKEMIFKPRQFFGGLSFRLTAIVYFGTYAVANLSEMFLDLNKVRDDETRKTIKVGASAVANIGLLAWRDSVFAREFSASKPKAKTPLRTIGLFAARDGATMYATFYAAPSAAEYLQEEYGMGRYESELGCALAIPVFTQIVTAPLHIHAMDFYAKPEASTADRIAAIRKEMGPVSFARGFRILPAFGIGSFSNNRFREFFIRHTWDPEPVSITRKITEAITGRKMTVRATATSPEK